MPKRSDRRASCVRGGATQDGDEYVLYARIADLRALATCGISNMTLIMPGHVDRVFSQLFD